MKSCKKRKKVFSMFKLLSAVMAVAIILTGCTGTPGEDGRDGVDGKDGKDGKTPTITINKEGYWVINGEVTTYKAVASDGKNGLNGKDGKDGKDGVNGQDGKDALTPTIEINKDGYWVINGEVTNIKAKGNDGKPGADGKDGKDGQNGVNGINGVDGTTPTIEINEEGYWVINGVVTEYKAVADEKETIVMEGDGQTFHRLAPSTLSFRSTAPLDEFQEVQINGETVDPSNYTLTEGSTIVTFNIDYLQSLGTEKHQVTVVSDSVNANAKFEVIEPELSEYGFYYNLPYIGYVEDLDTNFTFLYGKNGFVTMLDFEYGTAGVATFEYVIEGNKIIWSYEGQEMTFKINDDSLYWNEFAITLALEESVVADEDYIYAYNEELAGYEVVVIDNTLFEYIDIKSNIHGKPVVGLMGGMFQGNSNLIVAPKIPESVTYIGREALGGCTSLTSITIPKSVTHIGDYALAYTPNLTTINYRGTEEEWNAIEKGENWDLDTPTNKVINYNYVG